VFRDDAERRGVDIFELKRRNVDGTRKCCQRRTVIICRAREGRRNFCRTTIRVGRENMNSVTERRRRKRKHPPQLTAAYNTNC
jgi:hypothetical protein